MEKICVAYRGGRGGELEKVGEVKCFLKCTENLNKSLDYFLKVLKIFRILEKNFFFAILLNRMAEENQSVW